MKKIAVIFLIIFVSCSENFKNNNSNSEFYKFFDPFSFKGIQRIDSTSKNFPFYKLYFDSSKNIVKIKEYLSEDISIESKVRNIKNVRILIDSSDGGFEDEISLSYRFCYPDKIVSITNFLYTNTNRTYTNYLNIYTPNKVLDYVFFGDGLIDKSDIDSTYLRKITYLNPESILTDKIVFDESLVERKSIRDISNTQDEIIVKTVFTNKDTTVNQTFNYSNKKYDNFWVAKYNFFDSIAAKLYYDKHYKNL